MAKKVKMKKNKMKTHKGLKKVLNIRQSGSISIKSQGTRHNTGKNSAKRSRQKRKGNEFHSIELGDFAIISDEYDKAFGILVDKSKLEDTNSVSSIIKLSLNPKLSCISVSCLVALSYSIIRFASIML